MDYSLILQASKFNRIKASRFGLAGLTSTSNLDASTRAGGGGQLVTGGGGQFITGSVASVGGGRSILGSPAFSGPRGRAKPVRKVSISSPKDLSNTERIYAKAVLLYIACMNNHHQIVSALLGIPDICVNVRSAYGHTPIMMSAMHCHKEALKLMLEDSRVDLNIKDGEGNELNVLVGKVDGTKEQKEECVEMINKERIKRENRHVEQGQTGGQIGLNGNVRMSIEKIEKLNKEIENGEKKLEDRLDIKKKKKDLKRKQTLEKLNLVKRHKVEDAVLDEKHKEEETMLDATFAKIEEVERRRISILKERRDELVENVQKKTSEPGKDAVSNDHEKLEFAKKSLECPICMDFMRPPTRIWMCQFTHMICEGCRDQLNGGNCPTCTTEAITQRAFMAENLARTIFND